MNLGVIKDNKEKRVSFADLCFLIMGFGSLIFWYANGMNGNDFWWHVKAGEYICKTGQIQPCNYQILASFKLLKMFTLSVFNNFTCIIR